MDPAPQGLVRVRSAPAGAGRRGRRDALDIDEIVAWVRADVWNEYATTFPVAFNAVARWRQKYRDIRFRTFQRHLVEFEDGDDGTRKQLMCFLYVTCVGADGQDDDGDTG